MDQYRSMASLNFKAGALIKNDSKSSQKLHLYLAMETSVPTSMLSYLKYEVDINTKSTNLIASSHNFFKGLNLANSHACFMNNSLFLFIQKLPTSTEKPSIEAYLVDLENPNLDYSYPLGDFNISLMSEVKVLCKPEHELIVLRGWVNDTDSNKALRKNIYLNGVFANANYRVLQITDELGSVECDISFTVNYIIERHEDKKDSSSSKSSIRFIRLRDPLIQVAVGQAGTVTQHVVKVLVGDKAYPLKIQINAAQTPISLEQPTKTTEQFRQAVNQLLQATCSTPTSKSRPTAQPRTPPFQSSKE